MLRPAPLLPPSWLLTPRSACRDLSRRLGPATRRSGSSLGGTCTRWIGDAFRTHHVPYDYLVVATGPHLSFDEIPGLGPDKGYTDCTFTLGQALRTAQTWKRILEKPGP